MSVVGPESSLSLSEDAYFFYETKGFTRQDADFYSSLLCTNNDQRAGVEFPVLFRFYLFKAAVAEFERLHFQSDELSSQSNPLNVAPQTLSSSIPADPITPIQSLSRQPLAKSSTQRNPLLSLNPSAEQDESRTKASPAPITFLARQAKPLGIKTPCPAITPPTKPTSKYPNK